MIMKDIKNFSNYRVSSQGDVVSTCYNEPRLLKHGVNNGYHYVRLYKGGKQYLKMVHRLVLEAFGEDRNKPCVNHKDGNKHNNNVDNLEWCTYSENNKHAREVLGKTFEGEKSGRTKLKTSQVSRMRLMNKLGTSYNKIAKLFDVSKSCVAHIIKRRVWTHI